VHVTGQFDGGRIQVDSCAGSTASLRIRKDGRADFRQWFAFRCTGEANRLRRICLVNAGECNRLEGWRGFRAVASYDQVNWFRIPTSFDGMRLQLGHATNYPVVHYAQFALYSRERHDQMLSLWQTRAGVKVEVIGESIEGRPIDMITVGEPSHDKLRCWIIARQHPCETMAEWAIEGLLRRLILKNGPELSELRRKAVFFVIPNANPDGSFHGFTRTNAAGRDLNRAWRDCNRVDSPEIDCIRTRMEATGVDFFLDIHGEESIPYCFVAPSEDIPSVKPMMVELRQTFQKALLSRVPTFQVEHGYPPEEPGKADLAIGANYVAETYGCLSLTLEQPFKDIGEHPEDEQGWCPRLSGELGAACLSALGDVADALR
jgi:murein tripeptide amidase MpaA